VEPGGDRPHDEERAAGVGGRITGSPAGDDNEERKMRLKLLIMVMALLMAGSFVACQAPPEGEGGVSGAAVQPPEPNEEPEEPVAPEQPAEPRSVADAAPVATLPELETLACDAAAVAPTVEVTWDAVPASPALAEETRAALEARAAAMDAADALKTQIDALLAGRPVTQKELCQVLTALRADVGDAADVAGGTGAVTSLSGALSSLGGGSKYIRLEYIEKACGGNDECLAQLAQLREYLAAECPSRDACSDPAVAALLFGNPPSRTQEQAGICPSTSCAQISTVQGYVDTVIGEQPASPEEPAEPGEEPAGGDEPADPAKPAVPSGPSVPQTDAEKIEFIAGLLDAQGNNALTLTQVQQLAERGGCADCGGVLADFETYLGTLAGDPTNVDSGIAQGLVSGAAAAASDIARLLRSMA
jgi:hypothetical protein